MSKFIIGKDRNQTEFFCLEQVIDQSNSVRIIDLFVDSLSLKDMGFKTEFIENGRPAYHPADLLKLFLYGYLNRTRSSRQLEKECIRNLEVIWLQLYSNRLLVNYLFHDLQMKFELKNLYLIKLVTI